MLTGGLLVEVDLLGATVVGNAPFFVRIVLTVIFGGFVVTAIFPPLLALVAETLPPIMKMPTRAVAVAIRAVRVEIFMMFPNLLRNGICRRLSEELWRSVANLWAPKH